MSRILIVDDDLSLREVLSILFFADGYQVEIASNGVEALTKLNTFKPEIVLSDMNMPRMSGLELLEAVKAWDPSCPFVVITAFGSTDSAVDAMKLGASNYVLKPFNNDELRLVVQRALGSKALMLENSRLRGEQEHIHFSRLVGSSAPMMQVYEMIRRVQSTTINCMILGESGTGKELVARSIHFSSERSSKPFVALNCGAIPESLFESELFGHKKGSFTGAIKDKMGLFRAADGGTLFLDEVDSLPLSEQVKVLRAIQEKKFTPVGGVQEIEVDVRIISASNQDLESLVQRGAFREDLYYRLNVIEIVLPPLRDRGEDVEILTRYFIDKFARDYGKSLIGIAPQALSALKKHYFKGNVRELQNLIERAVALSIGGIIQEDDFPFLKDGTKETPQKRENPPDHFPAGGINLDEIMLEIERSWVQAALKAADGNKTRAAALLQISFRSFRYRLNKLGLE